MTRPGLARCVHASDQALLVVFDDAITAEAQGSVLALAKDLAARPLPGLLNYHPAYASVMLRYDPLRLEPGAIEREVLSRLARLTLEDAAAGGPIVEIPVRYGGTDGPDLGEVARLTGLDEDAVIARHAGAEYRVAFLGFTAGFPYLTGLSGTLSVPRLQTPRTRVPAGSVAIAGTQAGIYPLECPGGWRLIGRTPLPLFRPESRSITMLHMGDRVRFVPLPA